MPKKQDESDVLKQQLLKIISHDVYSPLRFSTMVGKAVVLQKDELDRDEVLDTLEEINITNSRILLLLSNILKVIEFDREKCVPHFYEENLHALVKEKLDLITHIAKSKGVQIKNLVSTKINFSTDKILLGIIIQNLLSNAVKFTSEGGSVEVNATLVRKKLSITITDTGKGIPAKMIAALNAQQKIKIEPDTEGIKGHGLGWWLIKELLQLLNGSYLVTSTIKKGTSVVLYFKVA